MHLIAQSPTPLPERVENARLAGRQGHEADRHRCFEHRPESPPSFLADGARRLPIMLTARQMLQFINPIARPVPEASDLEKGRRGLPFPLLDKRRTPL